MKLRQLTTIYSANKHIDDGEMLLWRALPLHQRTSLGPFVFIDHYRHEGLRGIGDRPHPHAGIEVFSYLIEGGVAHRDSFGFSDTIKAGDSQYICAGRGIIHAEQPTSPRHGLQLWTSLPPNKKLIEPSYRSLRQAQIPKLNKNGAEIRIIAGVVDGIRSPLQTVSEPVFAYVKLPANTTVTLSIDAEELGVYVTKGELPLGHGELLGSEGLAVFGAGDTVKLSAGDAPVELALLGGAPAEGPILFDGPFVMDTPERLRQAYEDYHSGKMGKLV
ncbi:pirin family protein [Moraxella porci]|uniref:pirin family protein n=1 Tax=Moraxella porci TaxID=1288392 RepID=UPI0024474D44|nr:pirin family protein [Moraxella porci]MDH2273020.1 pirin family protein [Moraxella porci]